MNASKRKFNTLLSNFGNRSTTSLPSRTEINNDAIVDLCADGDTDLQAKKRRLGRPISALSYNASHIPTKTSSVITNMSHQKSLSLATGSPAPTDTPRYAPWDRKAFLKRLESFRSVTDWTPKPANVNEVEWAKRGWVCKGWERVRCELCNVEILVKLNVKEVDGEEKKVLNASDIEDALVEKYAQLIVASHADSCLWRQRGCDETIFKLPLNHAPTAIQGLRERYEALCSIKDRLPYMHNMHPPNSVDLEVIIGYLPKNFFDSAIDVNSLRSSSHAELNRVALMMAMFGWTARPETEIREGAAVCEACFRTLGLWLFKSKEVDAAGEMVREATMNYLDLVEQHREYCPWKDAKSQSGGTASKVTPGSQLAAWQVLIRVLKNDHVLRQTGKEAEKEKAKTLTDAGSRPSTASVVILNDEDAQNIREEKDKERWARLRRVKSLFDTKSKKLQKNPPVSDPRARGLT